jgi:hypothetical protein
MPEFSAYPDPAGGADTRQTPRRLLGDIPQSLFEHRPPPLACHCLCQAS